MVAKNKIKKKFKLRRFIFFIILLIAITSVYSRYIGTTGIFVKAYNIKSSKITDNFHGFTIVHITDIHYGRTTHKKELTNLVNQINECKPNIVVLTGDLIDRDTKLSTKKINELSSILNKIDTSVGKYAIKGNHDYKFDEWENIINNSGFMDLNDKYDTIYYKNTNYILLSGISTLTYGKSSINERLKSTNDFLSNASEKPIYSILLLHEPDFVDQINNNYFDLILAGHSHNGQIRLPFIGPIYTPEHAKKYYSEHYKIKNSNLYISSGIGTSTINFRLFDRPSFNIYKLLKK